MCLETRVGHRIREVGNSEGIGDWRAEVIANPGIPVIAGGSDDLLPLPLVGRLIGVELHPPATCGLERDGRRHLWSPEFDIVHIQDHGIGEVVFTELENELLHIGYAMPSDGATKVGPVRIINRQIQSTQTEPRPTIRREDVLKMAITSSVDPGEGSRVEFDVHIQIGESAGIAAEILAKDDLLITVWQVSEVAVELHRTRRGSAASIGTGHPLVRSRL